MPYLLAVNASGKIIIWTGNFVAYLWFLTIYLGESLVEIVIHPLLVVIMRWCHKKLGLFTLLHLQYDD